MGERISLTTVQQVRRFLTSLDLPSSPYACADEVMALLVESVKMNRGNPTLREQINELLVSLATENGTLPVFSCETVDPTELARELTALTHPDQNVPAFAVPRTSAMLMLIAVLLLGMSLFTACQDNSADGNDEEATACVEDLSLDNFIDIIDQGPDISYEDRTAAIEEYESLNDAQREALIEELCGMTPEQIAEAIEDMTVEGDDDSVNSDDDNDNDNANIADDDSANTDDDSADDDFIDDDVAYKGVTF